MNVVKQSDAIELADERPGGWDVIFWDPPYLNDERNVEKQMFDYEYEKHVDRKRMNFNEWQNSLNIQHRLEIDQEYLGKLREIIESKITDCLWVEVNKYWYESDYNFIWYKGQEYGSMGYGYIRKNCSFFSIKRYGNKKPERYKYPLKMIEEHPFNRNGQALEIPISLLLKIFKFCQANYVFDPFAGSYNTTKACMKLDIQIDSCDKFISPPKEEFKKYKNKTKMIKLW